MTRAQALVLAVLLGLVLLVFVGFAIVWQAPFGQLFDTVFTPTLSPTLTVTPTPTFPNFMPTPNLTSPTPAEPTAVNTRLPTATTGPTRTPSPTVIFSFPTPVVRPTATLPLVQVTPEEAAPTPTLAPARQYTVFFEADDLNIVEDTCTDLEWRVQGEVMVWLDDEPVDKTGTREVCPRRNTTYTLVTQLAGSSQLRRNVIRISVEEDDE